MIKMNEKHVMTMTNLEIEKEIKSLLKSTGRENIDKLIEYMESSGFFSDPASTKYHLAIPGGLARHSLSVCREAMKIYNIQPDIVEDNNIEINSLIIATLLHDLCKIGKYVAYNKNVKNDKGVWNQVRAYKINENPIDFYGHGSGSVLRAMEYIQLNKDEKEAIINHMGCSNKSGEDFYTCLTSMSHGKLIFLTHLGDYISTFLVEGNLDLDGVEGLSL